MKQIREDGLVRGYTTGSCAAAASYGAMVAAITGIFPDKIKFTTPVGLSFELDLYNKEVGENWAQCAVKKFSGDDPDVTAGTLVFSRVELKEISDVIIDGGKGVGRVTKAGLACEPGMAAINPTPRRMIKEEVTKAMKEFGWDKGALVTISVPDGEELAKKTFNPKLGIIGGISILGTTGVVEPMSEKALIDTIGVEISVLVAAGKKHIVITPGNYGKDFLKEYTQIKDEDTVKCSNFIGESMDFSVEYGVEGIVFSGHLGKLIKIAGGVMNTHSKYGDRRMEILWDYVIKAGGKENIKDKIFECVMVDAALDILQENGIMEETMKLVVEGARNELSKRLRNKIPVATMTYTNKYGLLAKSNNIEEIMERIDG